jgi:hypothetical protein
MATIKTYREAARKAAMLGAHKPDRFTRGRDNVGVPSNWWCSQCKDCQEITYLQMQPDGTIAMFGALCRRPCQANFAKAELDNLLGTPMPRRNLTCLRCNYTWERRGPGLPKKCARYGCASIYWNTPRKEPKESAA